MPELTMKRQVTSRHVTLTTADLIMVMDAPADTADFFETRPQHSWEVNNRGDSEDDYVTHLWPYLL